MCIFVPPFSRGHEDTQQVMQTRPLLLCFPGREHWLFLFFSNCIKCCFSPKMQEARLPLAALPAVRLALLSPRNLPSICSTASGQRASFLQPFPTLRRNICPGRAATSLKPLPGMQVKTISRRRRRRRALEVLRGSFVNCWCLIL